MNECETCGGTGRVKTHHLELVSPFNVKCVKVTYDPCPACVQGYNLKLGEDNE